MNARPDCHAVPDSVAAGQAHAGNIGRNRTEIVRVNPSTIAGNQDRAGTAGPGASRA